MQLSGREIPSTQPVRALGTNSRDDCVRVGASTSPCWAQMAGVEAGGCRGATSCHVHTAAPNLRKTPSISPNTHPSHHPPDWDGGGQHTGHSRARLVPRWATQPGQELLTVSSIPTAQQHGAAGHGGLRARASRDSPCCHQLSFPGEGLFHLAARLEQQPAAEGEQAGSKAGASLRAYVHSHRDLRANGARGRAARRLEHSPGMLHPLSHQPKLKHAPGDGGPVPQPCSPPCC